MKDIESTKRWDREIQDPEEGFESEEGLGEISSISQFSTNRVFWDFNFKHTAHLIDCD